MWHDDASIIGNREALSKLRDAIDKALQDEEAVASSMTNDGEGYDVIIICKENDWDEVAFPYTDEIAAERREDAKYAYKLCKDYKKLKGL